VPVAFGSLGGLAAEGGQLWAAGMRPDRQGTDVPLVLTKVLNAIAPNSGTSSEPGHAAAWIKASSARTGSVRWRGEGPAGGRCTAGYAAAGSRIVTLAASDLTT